METSRHTRPSPSLPKRYAGISLLGTGGFGRVYRVHDSVRNLDLALKVVGPTEANWLLREFDTFRQIRHENLIRVFDWGALPSGEAYYTMELVEGENWGMVFARGRQPIPEAKRILTAVLRALAHLHSHGEIHRDLKPGNVLLGRGGVVKVTDIGMGTAPDGQAGFSGTPGYSPPEIWEGAEPDARSDLYSAGVIAYEAIVGQHPFAGKTVREVVMEQREGWVTSPAAHGVRVPPEFERNLMRAMERDPARRHATADEFMFGLGVEDRIGEIIGGKLCAREAELHLLAALMDATDPERPTLLRVTGPPGVGRTALLEEFSQRLATKNGIVAHVGARSDGGAGLLAAAAEVLGMKSWAAGKVNVSALAEFLWEGAQDQALLVWIDTDQDEVRSTSEELIPLARFIWAISKERGEGRRVLLGLVAPATNSSGGPFVRELELSPFSVDEVSLQLEGILGRSRLQPELVQKLHSLTGGLPGAVASVVNDLIHRQVLDRRDGFWVFQEVQELQTLDASSQRSRWEIAWTHLNADEREMMRVLAIPTAGVFNATVVQLHHPPEPLETLAALKTKGWAEMSVERWAPMSEEIRRTTLSKSTAEELRATGLALLSIGGDQFDREEKADLLLAYVRSDEALSEGIWAADSSAVGGHHRRALARFSACVSLAHDLGRTAREQEASLGAARALIQLGTVEKARDLLLHTATWRTDSKADGLHVERLLLLGICERNLGNNEEARASLTAAIAAAEGLGERTLALKSQSELAEIEWRFGDPAARTKAIERIRNALESAQSGQSTSDEIAALTYQLGAALVISGRREEARGVIGTAARLDCSDYWRMRLANADAAAAYHLGQFNEVLELTDQAWRLAERVSADHLKPRILANRAAAFYALGRIQEVLRHDLLAAQWALRIGAADDLETAANGAAISLILLGRYEEAIEQARKAEEASIQLGDPEAQATSIGHQAQSFFLIGDHRRGEELTRAALQLMSGSSAKGGMPRLQWLLGRLLLARNDVEGAEKVLMDAERQLLHSKDWEDLPGVQIELNLLRGRREWDERYLVDIAAISRRAVAESALIVQLYAAVGIGEIVVDLGVNYGESREILLSALQRAEGSGIVESVWRIAFYLGEMASAAGDSRDAQSKFRLSLNTLREVADRLTVRNRALYLASPHVASTIAKISPRVGVG